MDTAGPSPSAQPCNLTLHLGDVGAQEASGEAEGTRLYCTCWAAERPVNFDLKMGGRNLAATVQQRHRAEGPLGSQVAGHGGEASRPVALPPPYWQRSWRTQTSSSSTWASEHLQSTVPAPVGTWLDTQQPCQLSACPAPTPSAEGATLTPSDRNQGKLSPKLLVLIFPSIKPETCKNQCVRTYYVPEPTERLMLSSKPNGPHMRSVT